MHGWRAHLGKISPEPIEAWVTREFYEVMPEGIDITIALLQSRKGAPEQSDDIVGLVGRPAELLAERGADVIYLDAIVPVVAKRPGFDRELVDEMERSTGRKSATGMTAVSEAFGALGIRRPVMISPFEDAINDRIKLHLAASGVDIIHMRSVSNELETGRDAAQDELEYALAHRVFAESASEPDGVYLPFGGWGTVRNVARLEHDLGKPVVTSQTAMMWWFLENAGVKAPIRGYGSLLATVSAQGGGDKSEVDRNQ